MPSSFIRKTWGASLTRLDRRARFFAAALAAVAGYIDAAGFLLTGGYFVSFMSGNSTRLGLGLVRGAAEAALAASLVGSFVAGVVVGATIRRLRRSRPEAGILAVVWGLLMGSGYVASHGLQLPAALLLAGAMGAENTIFAEAGEVRVGLTYMTGALVKVGKGITAALFGEGRFAWAPHLMLWLSLVCGATLGAVAYARLGPTAIWIAAAAVALLTLLSITVLPLRPLAPKKLGESPTLVA